MPPNGLKLACMFPEPVDKENRPQFVEIETTEELAKDQNFYDQEPFSSAIAQTVTESETDPSRLRKILTVFCGKQFSDTEDLPKDAKVLDILTNPKYNPEYAKLYSKYFEPGQSEKYRKAMAILGRLLAPYPNWYPYVKNYRAGLLQPGRLYEGNTSSLHTAKIIRKMVIPKTQNNRTGCYFWN